MALPFAGIQSKKSKKRKGSGRDCQEGISADWGEKVWNGLIEQGISADRIYKIGFGFEGKEVEVFTLWGVWGQCTNSLEYLMKAMDLIERLAGEVPVFELGCDISEGAVECLERVLRWKFHRNAKNHSIKLEWFNSCEAANCQRS